MSGFAPRGHYPFRDIREIMGADTLGAWLAAGDFIAHAVGDDGEILPLPLAVWRTADAAQIMADGDLAPPDGGSPVPLLITSRRLGDLIAIMEARSRRAARTASAPPPANDDGKWSARKESQAIAALAELADTESRPLTRAATKAKLLESFPDMPNKAFLYRIWPKAPGPWHDPGPKG